MKKMSLLAILLLSTNLLAGCFQIPLGDGNKLKIGRGGITVTDAEGQERSIAFDEENENIVFSGFGEDGEENFAIGSNLDVPKGLPEDIPVPSNIDIYQTTSIQRVITFAFLTEIDFDKLKEQYKNHINSKTYKDQDMSEYKKDDVEEFTLYGSRADGDVNIFIGKSADRGKSVDVRITFMKSEE